MRKNYYQHMIDILLNDGLIKERFSALLTDSIRTEVLRAKGYSVDIRLNTPFVCICILQVLPERTGSEGSC